LCPKPEDYNILDVHGWYYQAELTAMQSPTLGAHAHAHAHGFWVGMGAMLLFMGGRG